MRLRTCVAAGLVAGVVMMTATSAMAGDESSDARKPIVVFGAVLTNLGYFPAKIIYSTVGGVTGALAYVVTVGDSDTATSIWDSACRGTYIVTPDMLEGKEPIRFSGK